MNRTLKKTGIIALVTAMVALVILGNVKRSNSTLKDDTKALIDYCGETALITESTIARYIQETMPWVYTEQIKNIKTDEIQEQLSQIPYIAQNEVSISMGGKLTIKAVQRNPVVRIINRDAPYYLDSTGYKMPLSSEGTSNIIIGNGEIQTKEDLKKIVTLATFIYNNSDYRLLFDQIHINKKDELTLVPKMGHHIVVVGEPCELEKKLENLMTFYKKGMPEAGWSKYSKINLKYDDQVICTKK